jgi:hypothetical protein
MYTFGVTCILLNAFLGDETFVVIVPGSDARRRLHPGSALIVHLFASVESALGLLG